MGTPQRNRPFWIPKRAWKDNIRLDIKETRWEVADWNDLTQDRDKWLFLVNTVMSSRVL